MGAEVDILPADKCKSFLQDDSRVRQFVCTVYICMATFIDIHMILDVCTLTSRLIFSLWFLKVFKIFLSIILYCLKTYCYNYIWPLILMFVLKRERFYTVYIYFKETLFFNFSYKLFKKYFFASQSTCCQFRVAARKLTKIAMCMYVEILYSYKKAVH